MDDKKLILTPTKTELNDLREWLQKEDETDNIGFYCNWSLIEEAFNQSRLFTFYDGKQSIGFVCFRGKKVLAVDFFEIHPKYRRKGLGKLFFNLCITHFLNNGVYALELECSPESSKPFWKKLGFVDFPIGMRKASRHPDLLNQFYQIVID